MLKTYLFVFMGGGLGSCIRFFISKNLNNEHYFGTLTVNILGSLFVGILFALLLKKNITDEYYVLLAIGFCGGLTTFSTFSLENYHYFVAEKWSLLLLHLIIFPIIALITTWFAIKIFS